MKKPSKIPVTARALMQRINRRLRGDRERIVKARGKWALQVGDYYRIDLDRNAVIGHNENLEALGRELRVLRPYETLQD